MLYLKSNKVVTYILLYRLLVLTEIILRQNKRVTLRAT